MKKLLFFYITIIVVVLFYSCGQREGQMPVNTKAQLDSVSNPRDEKELKDIKEDSNPDFATAAPGKDTLAKAAPTTVTESQFEKPLKAKVEFKATPPPDIQNPQGTLVYYCPSHMLESTDNNVSVTITKAALSQAIDQLERKVAATTGKPVESIQKDITGSSIKIAAKMKVELKYGEKDFETIYKPENDDQIFDGTNDMNWDWIIKPMKVGLTQLTIIISAYDEKNGRWIAAQTPPKIFNIKVQVDPRGYFAKLWEFLETHPEWLFMQILFPLIAFFFGKKLGKKSE